MEVKFDIVKPNLYVIPNIKYDEIFFSLDGSEVIPVCRDIDKIIAEHIGDLKVTKSELEVAETGESKLPDDGVYEVPFKKFLDALKSRNNSGFAITERSAELFGLSYIVKAQTFEDWWDIRQWKKIQEDLHEPDKLFDGLERENVIKLDRERTLEEMKKVYQELNQKVPENLAFLYVIDGSTPLRYEDKKVGAIYVEQLKAKDRTNIENCKSELVERLKEVDGPCLSLDAPVLIAQSRKLYFNAEGLASNYGDILTNLNGWRERFFRLDP